MCNAGIESLENVAGLSVPNFGGATYQTSANSLWEIGVLPEVPPVTGTGSPDVDLTKSVIPGFAQPGDEVVFSVRVFNRGDASVFNVEMIDPVPAELLVLSATFTQGGGDIIINGQTVTATIAELGAGAEVVIEIYARVRPNTATPFTIANVARVGDRTGQTSIISISALPDTG